MSSTRGASGDHWRGSLQSTLERTSAAQFFTINFDAQCVFVSSSLLANEAASCVIAAPTPISPCETFGGNRCSLTELQKVLAVGARPRHSERGTSWERTWLSPTATKQRPQGLRSTNQMQQGSDLQGLRSTDGGIQVIHVWCSNSSPMTFR